LFDKDLQISLKNKPFVGSLFYFNLIYYSCLW